VVSYERASGSHRLTTAALHHHIPVAELAGHNRLVFSRCMRICAIKASWSNCGNAMTTIRTDESHGRKLTFILVVLSHCPVIFMIGRSNIPQKAATQNLHEERLFVFFVNDTRPKTGGGAIKEPAPARARTELRRPSPVSPTSIAKQTESEAAPSNAITDWYAEAHEAAGSILEGNAGKGAKRAFEHKMPSAEEREKTSIFAPAPTHRAGTWDGPDSFYVTDNCRYEYDRAPRPPPTALDNRLMTPVCKPPPKGGGDAMFKDLTPDYLKVPPAQNSP
jgi:hypothetical protein